ncbi:hypothetical protein N7520_002517 [Penicillium odoratum]|uniref:uncharacterized protein n=1 Tax=Penicillium odoratum TaxID=1167516 RepID=UPI002548B9C6|nr:uncharacterized protein N7520_002517 [Penicillium odoratum]KAJ5771988.1 hypothetical protein N7520_002517 [Penicillium odoratum]
MTRVSVTCTEMASPASSKVSSKSHTPTDSNPEIKKNRHGILFKRPGRRLASDFALEEQSTSLPSSNTFSLDYTELSAQRGRNHAVYPRDSMKFVPNSVKKLRNDSGLSLSRSRTGMSFASFLELSDEGPSSPTPSTGQVVTDLQRVREEEKAASTWNQHMREERSRGLRRIIEWHRKVIRRFHKKRTT